MSVNKRLVKEIHKNLEEKTTDELIKIYQKHNVNMWSEETFEAIRQLLIERGETIPDIYTVSKMKDSEISEAYAEHSKMTNYGKGDKLRNSVEFNVYPHNKAEIELALNEEISLWEQDELATLRIDDKAIYIDGKAKGSHAPTIATALIAGPIIGAFLMSAAKKAFEKDRSEIIPFKVINKIVIQKTKANNIYHIFQFCKGGKIEVHVFSINKKTEKSDTDLIKALKDNVPSQLLEEELGSL